jgi:hypothetical protein
MQWVRVFDNAIAANKAATNSITTDGMAAKWYSQNAVKPGRVAA